LIRFLLRDDVQAAFERTVAALRKQTLWTCRTVLMLTRRTMTCCLKVVRFVARRGLRLCRGVMRIVRLIASALAQLLARLGQQVKAFTRSCVEAGNNAR
jgi:hypothetical protein